MQILFSDPIHEWTSLRPHQGPLLELKKLCLYVAGTLTDHSLVTGV